jgi:hypothetical protein
MKTFIDTLVGTRRRTVKVLVTEPTPHSPKSNHQIKVEALKDLSPSSTWQGETEQKNVVVSSVDLNHPAYM